MTSLSPANGPLPKCPTSMRCQLSLPRSRIANQACRAISLMGSGISVVHNKMTGSSPSGTTSARLPMTHPVTLAAKPMTKPMTKPVIKLVTRSKLGLRARAPIGLIDRVKSDSCK